MKRKSLGRHPHMELKTSLTLVCTPHNWGGSPHNASESPCPMLRHCHGRLSSHKSHENP